MERREESDFQNSVSSDRVHERVDEIEDFCYERREPARAKKGVGIRRFKEFECGFSFISGCRREACPFFLILSSYQYQNQEKAYG